MSIKEGFNDNEDENNPHEHSYYVCNWKSYQ